LRTALIQPRAGGVNAAAGGRWLNRRFYSHLFTDWNHGCSPKSSRVAVHRTASARCGGCCSWRAIYDDDLEQELTAAGKWDAGTEVYQW